MAIMLMLNIVKSKKFRAKKNLLDYLEYAIKKKPQTIKCKPYAQNLSAECCAYTSW